MNTITQPSSIGFGSILESNKQEMSKIESYKSQPITTTPRNLAFAGLTAGIGIMFIMFAAQIITGMFAVLLTVGVGVGGFLSLRWLKTMDPFIKQKTKNYVLKKMFEEARNNAVQQLDNQVLTNRTRLLNAREARNKIGALLAKMEGKVNPAHEGTANHKRKIAMIETVRAAYILMGENLTKAAESDDEFCKKVIEYKDMDSFADIAGEALKMLNSSSSKQLEDMLSLEAFDHIDTNFNEAIVSIENSSRDYADDNL